ncbi:mediator of RNA polymerase II transcription subunit 29-like [Anneissia japonica]|uniref:mediator of RNA polymerase II transcription subunit 29-like n=1 Tax=Anneissia japonica TaxID=1529436 RepID=UPI0014255124|nr:mediator of RNA polymerase II transcription subunit 29-like [Anneissia japonica]
MAAVQPGVGITNPGSAGAPAVAPGVQQPAHSSTHHSSQQSQQDNNPISNVKADIPQLNKSLSNLMKIAAENFVHNAAVDNNGKVGDSTTLHRFDKALEDFYSHCDYIEVNLRLALECSRQHGYSVRYTPIQLPLAKQEPNVLDAQKYGQYANLVKTQIACVNDVQKALLDCAYNISHQVKREETANKP